MAEKAKGYTVKKGMKVACEGKVYAEGKPFPEELLLKVSPDFIDGHPGRIIEVWEGEREVKSEKLDPKKSGVDTVKVIKRKAK